MLSSIWSAKARSMQTLKRQNYHPVFVDFRNLETTRFSIISEDDREESKSLNSHKTIQVYIGGSTN